MKVDTVYRLTTRISLLIHGIMSLKNILDTNIYAMIFIRTFLLTGYQNTVYKDKFLIMAMEVANESSEPLAEMWKTAQRESIMEHR